MSTFPPMCLRPRQHICAPANVSTPPPTRLHPFQHIYAPTNTSTSPLMYLLPRRHVYIPANTSTSPPTHLHPRRCVYAPANTSTPLPTCLRPHQHVYIRFTIAIEFAFRSFTSLLGLFSSYWHSRRHGYLKPGIRVPRRPACRPAQPFAHFRMRVFASDSVAKQ
jgi:hypothetical protein